MPQVNKKATGIVKWFSRIKGYGFIVLDDDGDEIFVHYSAILGDGYKNLYEGDRVQFDIVDHGRGLQAENVTNRRSYSQKISIGSDPQTTQSMGLSKMSEETQPALNPDKNEALDEVNVQELLQQLKKKGRPNNLLRGCDLRGQDLSKTNLKNMDLDGTDLRGANLIDAILDQADFRGAILDETTLLADKWRLVWQLVNVGAEAQDLQQADLSQANLQELNLQQKNLKNADLTMANLTGASLAAANLRRANLANANLAKANLEDAILEWANLKDALFDKETKISEKWRTVHKIVTHPKKDRDLQGVDLSKAYLAKAYFVGANFQEANLEGAILKDAQLARARFHGALLDDATQIAEKWRLVWQLVNSAPRDLDLSQIDLSDANLEGSHLEKINLQGTRLNGAILKNSFLTAADLSHANLTGTNFVNADLNDAILDWAYLKDAVLDEQTRLAAKWKLVANIVTNPIANRDLSSCDLRRANLKNAHLGKANFQGANLSGAILKNATLDRARFHEAILDEETQISEKWRFVWRLVNVGSGDAKLSKVDLRYANLAGINLHSQHFAEVDLTGADLENADLSSTNFIQTNLSEANLISVNLSHTDCRETNLDNANLAHANISDAFFSNATLKGANLRFANLHNANLHGADLRNASLQNVQMNEETAIDEKWRLVWEIINYGAASRDLSWADLSQANLHEADLSGANLQMADLSGCNLAHAKLNGADLTNADLKNASIYFADYLLIIEEDFDISNMLQIFFRAQGYKVKVARRGLEAIALCQEQLPSLIILDSMLPDIDGYEVCRTLQANPHTQQLPIMFLTQRDERSDRLDALELGAVDYVTKPFDIEELKLRVRSAIRTAYLARTIDNPTPGRRVLVVEDDFDISNMLRIFFTGQGYQVDVAPRGNDALAMSRKNVPDLIILDIMLPDMNGYEICRIIRTSDFSFANVPIIFLTQKDERSDRIAGLELGANDYITKPFDIESLKVRVRNVLSLGIKVGFDEETRLPGAKQTEEKLTELFFTEAWSLILVHILSQPGASLINTVIKSLETHFDFVGRWDNDEFVFIVNKEESEELNSLIADRFDEFGVAHQLGETTSRTYYYQDVGEAKDLLQLARNSFPR